MTTPYYQDDRVQLYLGDCRDVLPALDLSAASCVIADPPYAQTALDWDRWPDGWLTSVANAVPLSASLWCHGNLRLFLTKQHEFKAAGWKLRQDTVGEWEIDATVWEKPNGSGFADGAFNRVHELVAQWYRGPWRDVHNDTPRVPKPHDLDKSVRERAAGEHRGTIAPRGYVDDGTRIARSVMRAPQVRGKGRNGTEKPVELVTPHIVTSCPPGGLLLDVFTGSGAVLAAARAAGRRAIGIEKREAQAESAARRLATEREAVA